MSLGSFFDLIVLKSLMLEEHPSFELAKMVKEQVEDWMEYLTQKGVLEGHIRGEYI